LENRVSSCNESLITESFLNWLKCLIESTGSGSTSSVDVNVRTTETEVSRNRRHLIWYVFCRSCGIFEVLMIFRETWSLKEACIAFPEWSWVNSCLCRNAIFNESNSTIC
jgi:hypothetical protein